MGLFGRKNKVVDLTEEYKPRKAPAVAPVTEKPASVQFPTTSSGSFFNMFGGSQASSQTSEPAKSFESIDPEEKRRRLARRLKDMTDRIEDLSNQMYLLQQRIEVLEKKTNIGQYE